MATDVIELSRLFAAPPERIYAAWLDAAEHSAMTGSPATIESAAVGGRYTAWDGYIDGSFVALEPGVRIVQSWRSDDFPADALDSLLEVRLEPVPGGARVTLHHGDLPEGQGPALLEGWEEFYFEPMERYFGRLRPREAKVTGPRAKARKPARKAATRRPARKVAKRKGAAKRAAARPAKKAAPRRGGRRMARRRR